MHLALIISSLNPGGAERVLSDLANHWISQGNKVSFITFATPTTVPFYPLDPKINLIQLDQSQHTSSPLKRFINSFKRILVLRKTLQQLKPDRIVSFVDITNITALIASIGLKIPIVVSERIDPNFHKIPSFYEWFRLKVYPLCLKLIVQTTNAATYFPKQFSYFMMVVPNPVRSPTVEKKDYVQHITHIISIGRLDQQKDHKTLIRSFSHLLKTHPDLTLTIYGEGRERPNLETLITSLNLQNKVHLPGTTQNIQEALLNADLFIFPSHYEGFPNALCEAMAVGLPVIASNCSGITDILRDGIDGRLFPIGDENALTKITLELLEDPVQCESLGTHAKEVSTRFSPTRVFAMWDNLLKKI
jgi:GalNAc-alpha-(1->4)-GalNAc-alpha-(1->3)-diNAcBac-PP-undecaprenol alpha-1,4-N-acetyl-D-galactosaminyltransferase